MLKYKHTCFKEASLQNQQMKLINGVQFYLIASVVRGGLLANRRRTTYTWRGLRRADPHNRYVQPDFEIDMPSRRPPMQKG